MKAVRRICGYLAATTDYGIKIGSVVQHDNLVISSHCDADYASAQTPDPDQLFRSIRAYFCFINGDPISWYSKLSPKNGTKYDISIAQSTVSAETNAAREALCEVYQKRCLLENLGFAQLEPSIIYCDSTGVIRNSNNPIHSQKMKIEGAKLQFIRQHVKKGTCVFKYIITGDNSSDILTKAISPNPQFHHLSKMFMSQPDTT